jgi:glyoxylase-like metal-dependent hydrolase (beta-lactamase superfamily II)
LLGSQYTDYLPIWVWVIEHPEGLITIDTGDIAESQNIDKFLANESGFMRYQMKHACQVKVDPKDELNNQFIKVGLKVENVKLVVLTHLHLDHTDGLKFFPKPEIIIGDYEFTHQNNSMPSTYPKWFKPNQVKYKPDMIEFFKQAYPITKNEGILYIPTPGHTHGHSSVLLKTDDFDIIFAGDSSYHQDQVLKGELAGANVDYKLTTQTYKNFTDYATKRKTIYLPTHDENAGERLAGRKFLI